MAPMIAAIGSIPSPSNGVLHVGPLPLHAYGLMLAIGVVVAVKIADREDASVAHEQTNRRVFRVEVTAIDARDGLCSHHRFGQLTARRIRLVENPQGNDTAFKHGCVQCGTLAPRFVFNDGFPVLDESIRRCFAVRAADLPLRSDKARREEEQRSRAEYLRPPHLHPWRH